MAETRRPRAATLEKRQRILDAVEEIMLKDGYAAVSSRSVATAVGIQAPLVHYYFPTLDDLFVAVLQRRAGAHPERLGAGPPPPGPPRGGGGGGSPPPRPGAMGGGGGAPDPPPAPRGGGGGPP